MPRTITSLFQVVGLIPAGVTLWGTRPSCKQNGVYVVALTADPNSLAGTITSLPASRDAIAKWMGEQRDLAVDDAPGSIESVCTRLARHWLPNEVALYVGKTEKKDGLYGRVGEFYRHKLGRSSPHRGGQWIKALSIMPQLYVHYAPCSDPIACESAMIGHFCANNSAGPFPFANLEWCEGGRRHLRKHGIH